MVGGGDGVCDDGVVGKLVPCEVDDRKPWDVETVGPSAPGTSLADDDAGAQWDDGRHMEVPRPNPDVSERHPAIVGKRNA